MAFRIDPRLWRPTQMNAWQFLALVGVVMTAAAHLLLWLTHRTVPHFAYLYPTWAALFVAGTIRNLTAAPDEDHHHHH